MDAAAIHAAMPARPLLGSTTADRIAADTPLGPEQAATRLKVRRADFDRMVRLGWIRSPQSIEVRLGTSRAGAVDVALCTTASVDASPGPP